MATKTGILSIVGTNSTLDDGTLLARCSDSSPLSAATAFLTGLGLQSGDRIRVTGTDGTIGTVSVFCMTAAERAVQLAATALLGAPKGKPRTRVVPSKKKAATKKPAATKRAKKSSKSGKRKARRRL
jgi:hypothetical protein